MNMDEMRGLVARLNETAYQYYTLSQSSITDKEWDALYDQLLAAEAELGQVLPDSPTRRVGSEPLKTFAPHAHLARLWSMDKAQSVEAVYEWARRAEKLREAALAEGEELPAPAYVVEHKFDGLTINLTYENGRLTQAATRGNGAVGEGILAQAMTIRSIPLTVPYLGRFEAHGEGYMRLSVLDEYNKTAAEPLKNPRNAAAGALRNLDPAVTAARRLDACFYGVGYIEGRTFADQAELLDFLREMRLPVSNCERYAATVEEAVKIVHEIEETRGELDYMIDGAVIKLTDMATRRALGYTDKFPRWAVAYKFEAEETTSKLLDVTWELGRTGKLTPLAHLEPVDIAGATIRRATLNNFGDIERKRLKRNCRVWLRRSNEVIPEIVGRVEEIEDDEQPIAPPATCPACQTPLVERGAHLFCPNRLECLPQRVMRLAHFAARDAMDIETFSEKTAEQLARELAVRESADLYALTVEQLAALPRFGETKARNLVNALDKSKDCALDQFLFAIGIPNVGRKTARDLAARYGTLEAVRAATMEELTAIDDVGEIVAGSVVAFFADPVNAAMVDDLLAAGVKPRPQAQSVAEIGPLSGLSVVLTGTLPNLTRAEAEKMIRESGGAPSASVSKKTGLVLAGEKAGSKLEKARALGIKIVDEAEFLEMLN